MLLGILAGLITGALWGLTFIAPRAISPFTPWDLTVARYGLFGLTCLILMVDRRFRPTAIAPRRLVIGLLLGGAGYVGYFISAALAVELAGAVIPPVIIGVMPVALAIIANRRDRSLSWSRLAGPLLLILAGVALVNITIIRRADPAAQASVLLGVLASLAALAIWIIYGVVNAAVMQSSDAPDGLRWTGVQGIGAALGSLLLLPLASFARGAQVSLEQLGSFIGWAVLMGLAGSWLATWCWVVAARRLPLALSAQLIVAETVFGLGYGFLFERRWPLPAEVIGAVLQTAGVSMAILVFTRARAAVG